jgi:hypothetical protein
MTRTRALISPGPRDPKSPERATAGGVSGMLPGENDLKPSTTSTVTTIRAAKMVLFPFNEATSPIGMRCDYAHTYYLLGLRFAQMFKAICGASSSVHVHIEAFKCRRTMKFKRQGMGGGR